MSGNFEFRKAAPKIEHLSVNEIFFPHNIGDPVFSTNFITKTQLEDLINENSTGGSNANVCKYDPRHDKEKSPCIANCIKDTFCNINDCETICNNRGPFLGTIQRSEPEPDPPTTIRLISMNKSLIIEFRKPKYEGKDSKIDKYIISVKLKFSDSNNQDGDTRLYTFNVSNEENHKYTLDRLTNNKFYDVAVLSHNNKNYTSKKSSSIATESPFSLESSTIKEDDIPIDEFCYSDEGKKYKFKSNFIDSEVVTNMYKDSNTFDKNLMNILGVPLEEDTTLNFREDEAVEILTSLDRDFSLIR
jgi:hypothetical protein